MDTPVFLARASRWAGARTRQRYFVTRKVLEPTIDP